MHVLRAVCCRYEWYLPELQRRTPSPAASNSSPMNYRHAYHAGNFADVHKHEALVCILQHLAKKERPFAVIDTHAGRALYDLEGIEAKKTAEAADGIEVLRAHNASSPVLR